MILGDGFVFLSIACLLSASMPGDRLTITNQPDETPSC